MCACVCVCVGVRCDVCGYVCVSVYTVCYFCSFIVRASTHYLLSKQDPCIWTDCRLAKETINPDILPHERVVRSGMALCLINNATRVTSKTRN